MASPQQVSIPPALQDIEIAILKSRRILGIMDEEDEEQPAYGEATLQRAHDFLLQNAVGAWHRYGVRVKAPIVSPGPHGSIDILWKTGKRELLANIPADVREPVNYYGNDRTDPDAPVHNTVEGTLDPHAQNEWLLVWLAQ